MLAGRRATGRGRWPAYPRPRHRARALARRDPGNTELAARPLDQPEQDRQRAAGRRATAGALAAYRAAWPSPRRWHARDPANTDWQRDLSVSHNKIGDVLVAQGDGPGALAAYRRDLAIAEALAARDPANTQWQTDVAVSCAKLGTLDHGQNWEARQRYLLRGKELLLTLQSAGRLMANQDWIEWFNEQLATLETFDNSDGKRAAEELPG